MDIDRLSASAMQVLEACPSRFKANQLAGRTGEQSGRPAMLGTTCHYAAEHFVADCVMQAKYPRDWETLKIFLMQGYLETFGNTDYKSPEFKECLEMMDRWYRRQDWDGFTVLTTEVKTFFMVPTSQGDKKFNYIFDRSDQMSETEYRVVDYKSLARPMSPKQLRDKLQARIYGLAMQIQFPQATKIWVEFDMFRWEGVVGTVFTREDNIDTWNRICDAFEVGYKIPDGEIDPKTNLPMLPPERLNEECGFCIKNSTCGAVMANIAAGGIHTYGTVEEKVNARALLALQKKAADDAIKDLDKQILAWAENAGETEVSTPLVDAKLVLRPTRKVDGSLVRELVGDWMFEKYGGVNTQNTIGLKDFDQLLKDPDLAADTRERLEKSITREYPDDPYLSTKLKAK